MRGGACGNHHQVVFQEVRVVRGVVAWSGVETNPTENPKQDVADLATQIPRHVAVPKLMAKNCEQQHALVCHGTKNTPKELDVCSAPPTNVDQVVHEKEQHEVGELDRSTADRADVYGAVLGGRLALAPEVHGPGPVPQAGRNREGGSKQISRHDEGAAYLSALQAQKAVGYFL